MPRLLKVNLTPFFCPWSRTVTYRYMGSDVWYITSNVLKGPLKEIEG